MSMRSCLSQHAHVDNHVEDERPYVGIVYEYDPSFPLYEEGKHNHTVRVYAAAVGADVCMYMQHLKISDPPYSLATQPGRSVDMTLDEFSEFVDGLVALRDRLERERK